MDFLKLNSLRYFKGKKWYLFSLTSNLPLHVHFMCQNPHVFVIRNLKSLQKFEAYDSKGAVVAGDKDKEVSDLIVQ